MRNILRKGNKKLNTISEEVKLPLNEKFIKNLNEMYEFLKNSLDPKISAKYKLRAGVGLAAPQIGVLKRFFVLNVDDFDLVSYSFGVINPVIIEHSENIIYLPTGEGCLSVDEPTIGLTPRWEWIIFEGYIFDFNLQKVVEVKMRLEGYVAICFQHELDHLNGILFTSKEFPKLLNAKNVYELDKYTPYLTKSAESHFYDEVENKEEVVK
jgi:peptide deformylase